MHYTKNYFTKIRILPSDLPETIERVKQKIPSQSISVFSSKLKIKFTYVKNYKGTTKQARRLRFFQINFFLYQVLV